MTSGREFRETKTGRSGNYPVVAGQRNSLTCDDVARNSHPAQDLDDSWHTRRGGDCVADDHGFHGQSGGSRATMDTQTGSTPRRASWSLLVSVTLRAHAAREALSLVRIGFSLVRSGFAPKDFESLQADVHSSPTDRTSGNGDGALRRERGATSVKPNARSPSPDEPQPTGAWPAQVPRAPTRPARGARRAPGRWLSVRAPPGPLHGWTSAPQA